MANRLFCVHCKKYTETSLCIQTGDIYTCSYCNKASIVEARSYGDNVCRNDLVVEDYTTGVNPKDALAVKKPPIHLVPPILEILTSLAFKDGSEKYGPFNWRDKKVKWTVYYGAAKRHLSSAFDGEDIDPISKVHHLAHAAACIAILMDAEACNCLIDDRPLKGPSAEVINKYTEKN